MSTPSVRPLVVSMTAAQKRDQIISFLLSQAEENDKEIEKLRAEINAYAVRNAQQGAQLEALNKEISKLQGQPEPSSPNAEATT